MLLCHVMCPRWPTILSLNLKAPDLHECTEAHYRVRNSVELVCWPAAKKRTRCKAASETLSIALIKVFGRPQQTNPDGKHSNPARGLGGTIGGRVGDVLYLRSEML